MSEEQAAAESTNAVENSEQQDQQQEELSSADKIFDGNAERPPEGPEGQKVETKPAEEDQSSDESASTELESEGQYEFEVDDDEPISDVHLEEIAEYASELKLSNEDAQKLVDMQSKAIQGYQDKLTEDFETSKEQWKLASENDDEIGGVEFPRNIEMAKRVIDKFGTEDFKKAVNETGFGNHPELLRLFTRIGKAMSEDSLVMPQAEAGKTTSMADKFYPTTSNNN